MLPKEIQNQFEILEELGRGGTAAVFKCIDKQSNQTIALKVGLDNSESEIPFKDLAAREFYLIGHYNYPGLVNILQNPDETAHSIVLEYCAGKSLENLDRIDDLKTALNIFSSVAINFHYLKMLGIEHGDVKPDNIFIPEDIERINSDRLWYSKLSDFSLGKFNSDSYDERIGIGTLGYSAPETIASKELTYLSDIFSFGVTMYQLLSGEHPFLEKGTDSDPVKINGLVQEAHAPRLDSLRDDIPVELADFVSQCMAKNSSDRPDSWLKICEILRELGASYPFEKAILPKYLIADNLSYSENIDCFLNLSDKEKRYIDRLNLDNKKLKHLLTFNFLKNNIHLDKDKFVFVDKIYCSPLFVKEELTQFNELPISDKKKVIKRVIIGKDETNIPDNLKTAEEFKISPLLQKVIINFISSNTIKRVSKYYFENHKNDFNNKTLTRLALQIGDIKAIDEFGYLAAHDLLKEDLNNESVRLLKKLVSFGELTGNDFELRNLTMLLADTLKNLGETEQSENYYFKLIKAYENQEADVLLGETYKDLGDIYKMKHNVEKGIEYLNRAIEIYEPLDREMEISNCLNNLGNLFWIKGELKEAANYYRKALRIQRKLNSVKHIASTLNNLGGIYLIKNKFTRGIKLLNFSLELKKELGDKGEIARTLNNIGFAYYLRGNPNKALSFLEESLELNRQIDSKNEILFNLENLSSIIIRAGRIKESINYLKEGTSLSKEMKDIPHETIFILNTAKVLGFMGRIDQALSHFNQAGELKDKFDDFIIESTYSLELAEFYKLLGMNSKALKQADTSLELGKKSGDESVVVESSILKLSLEYSQDLFEELSKVTQKTEQKRARHLLNFALLENKLRSEGLDLGEDIYKTSLSNFDEDIEASRVHFLYGLYLYQTGKTEDAVNIFQTSFSRAKQIGHVHYQFKALVYLGLINFENKEYEECYNYFQDALKVSRILLGNITDIELKESFSKLKEIQILSRLIKELKSKIKKNG